MRGRANALLTLIVTEQGQVEVEPGDRFTEDHYSLLTDTYVALSAVVKDHASMLTFGF